MAALRWLGFLGGLLLVVLVLGCGGAGSAKSYADAIGDVEGAGPDLVSVEVSNTKTEVTFAVRFATVPPLGIAESKSEGWIDMLLIGIDVPPIGQGPVPGSDWRGVDFALGTHGPSLSGVLVQQGVDPAEERKQTRFPITTSGSTLTFSIPRSALGDPDWFVFQAAAGREGATEAQGGGADYAPANGTFRYSLTD